MNYHHIHIKYSGIAGWITSQCKLFDRKFPNKFLCIPSALLSRIIWQNKPRVGPCVQVSPRLSQIELVWFYAFSHKLRMWYLRIPVEGSISAAAKVRSAHLLLRSNAWPALRRCTASIIREHIATQHLSANFKYSKMYFNYPFICHHPNEYQKH